MKPIQNLNGYDNPWVGGTGKNKLPYATAGTYNNVAVDVADDGTITLNGTASGTTYIDIDTNFDSTALAGYVFTGFPNGAGSSTTAQIRICTQSGGVIDRTGVQSFYTDGTAIADHGTGLVFSLRLTSGSAYTDYVISPMISQSGGDYEPYENICPIYGSTGATLYQTGKNLYPSVGTRTNNYITFSGEKGTYHVSGTASANATNDVSAQYANYPKLPAGTYIIGTSSEKCRITIRQFYDDGTAYAPLIYVPYNSEYTLTLEQDLIVMLGFFVTSGTTIDEDIYLMVQRSESENLVASTPDLADDPIGYDTWYFPSGTYEYSLDAVPFSTFIKGQLINPNDSDDFQFISYTNGGYPETKTGTINIPFPKSARLSFAHSADNLVFKRVYSTDSVFEEYSGTTYAVTWQSDAGTVYGGTYDFVSGVLTVTMAMHSFDGTETITEAGSRYFRYSISSDPADEAGKAVSSHFEYINSFASKPFGTFTMTSGNIVFNDADSVFADATAFQAFLAAQNTAGTPVQVCYTLATPITYQITPEQIKSFNGENNIWAMLTQGA